MGADSSNPAAVAGSRSEADIATGGLGPESDSQRHQAPVVKLEAYRSQMILVAHTMEVSGPDAVEPKSRAPLLDQFLPTAKVMSGPARTGAHSLPKRCSMTPPISPILLVREVEAMRPNLQSESALCPKGLECLGLSSILAAWVSGLEYQGAGLMVPIRD
jgi:hypothetical protein